MKVLVTGGGGFIGSHLVERLVIVCPQARIEPHHLPPELFRGAAESPQQPYSTLHEARSAYEREFILRKLQEHRWNMTQTAAALDLPLAVSLDLVGDLATDRATGRRRTPALSRGLRRHACQGEPGLWRSLTLTGFVDVARLQPGPFPPGTLERAIFLPILR